MVRIVFHMIDVEAILKVKLPIERTDIPYRHALAKATAMTPLGVIFLLGGATYVSCFHPTTESSGENFVPMDNDGGDYHHFLGGGVVLEAF